MRRNKLSKIDQIRDPSLLKEDGHNLARWVKELKISASIANSVPHFRLARDGSSWDVEKAHQAWRYGARVDPEDETALVAWMESLCHWAKEEMGR